MAAAVKDKPCANAAAIEDEACTKPENTLLHVALLVELSGLEDPAINGRQG